MTLFVAGRGRLLTGHRGGFPLVMSAFALFTPLGMLAKENAALLPCFVFLIEWVFFRFETKRPRDAQVLRLSWLIGLIAVSTPAVYFLAHHGWLVDGYGDRPFTLEERLLTECRILVLYLKWIVLPRGAELSLFHDDLPLSTGLLTPWSTLPCVLLIALLSLVAIALRKRAPMFAFGVLFFLIGQSMESSVIALELIHEHRNYVPSIGVLLALFYYLAEVATRLPVEAKKLPAATMAAAVALLLANSAFITATRAQTWSNAVQLASVGVTYHRKSSIWHYELGNAYRMAALAGGPLQNDFLQSARAEYAKAATLNPYYRAGDLIAVISTDIALKRPPDPRMLQEVTEALRTGPVSALTVVTMKALLLQISSAATIVKPAIPMALLDAIRANPELSPKDRGSILAAAGQLALNKMGVKQAIKFGIEALAAYPLEPQHYKNLATVAMERGNASAAKALLLAGEQVESKGVAPNHAEIVRLSRLAAR